MCNKHRTIIIILNSYIQYSLGAIRSKNNFSKFSIIFSVNVSNEDKNDLSTTKNIRQTYKIEKYLGLPITNHHP